MNRKLMLSSVLVLMLFVILAPSVLASTTWYVNGVRGSDTNNCKTPQTACKTIGHAVALAADGDTIMVAAATYTENLSLTIGLTIRGSGLWSTQPTIIDGGGAATVITTSGSPITLSGLTIQHGSGWGGGINNTGVVTINSSIIRNNSSGGPGGGIANYGNLTISNSTISGNSATNGWGGGLWNFDPGTLAINNSTVSGNAAYAGGGLCICGGSGTITNSTITGNNTTGSGGGIENVGNLTITNSTIARNTAGETGGGITNGSLYGYGGALTTANTTISGNGASQGGGIWNNSSGTNVFQLQDTIVADSSSGGNCYNYGGNIVSNGYNLSSDSSCATFFNQSGDLNDVDPLLGPLQNNGGPTWTQALLDGSPAIDAGNPSGCTDGNGNLLKTDQRGYPRPDPEDPSGCDMGAYERQGD